MRYLHSFIRLGVTLVFVGVLVGLGAAERVLISEFMAANNATLADEDGAFSDWVELYNAGSTPVNLGGWYLTDNAGNLTKWQFPATNLAANAYLVVFCSGKDRPVAGAPLHASFALSAGGEYLALVKPDGVTVAAQFAPVFPPQSADISYGYGATSVAMPLIGPGSAVRALVPSSDPGTTWRSLAFNDTAWASGTNGVGYDTGTNYGSVIGLNLLASMRNVRASAYTRTRFVVSDASLWEGLELNLRYDDGFVAFLNGQEVLRRNAPANLTWNAAATGPHGPPLAGSLAQNFEPPTPVNYTLSQLASAPGPALQNANAGSTGRFLRLINDGVNNHNNAITFAQTAPGLFQTIQAEFDFRIASVDDPADGFAFMLIPTSTYGTNGAGYTTAIAFEEPNIAGVFAVGFDVYPRGEPRNDVSVHWNGAERANVTLPNANLNLTSGQFHRARVTLTHVTGGANVTITLTPNINGVPGPAYTPINSLFVPGLDAYDCRVEFAGRTGGLNMTVDLDNLNVQFLPSGGALPFERFELSSNLAGLVIGTNLLALHGLNLSASDGDFLIDPRLTAYDIAYQTNVGLYFTPPTPGAANGPGALGVLAPPIFTPAGGLYTSAQTVTLSSSSSSATIRYTTDGSEPRETSPLYTAPITISASGAIRARAYQANYIASEVRGEPYTILGADVVNFNSSLPLVVINTHGGPIVDNVKNPGYVTTLDTFRGRASLRGTIDYQGRMGVELRGSSSLGFPKNSMNVELQDEAGSDRDAALLGLPAESDWVLYAPYTDKALMRDVLAYDLWRDMGHYSVRTRFVELFLDRGGGTLTMGDYHGIYVLIEKIKRSDDRVNVAALDPSDHLLPAISGGYIMKRDRFDENDSSFTTASGIGLGIEYPKDQELTATQRNWLIQWLNEMESVLYGAAYRDPTNGYAKYIDVASFIDHQWIVEVPKNIDGYRLSNFYHKDRHGKLREGPIWDWNLSFGNADYLEGDRTNGWYYPFVGDGDYPWYRRLFTDADFNQRSIDRWGELRRGVFATSNLLARIDAYTARLDEAQTREFQRWPRLGQYIWPNAAADWTNTTYAGTVNFMKNFTRDRLAWIDAQFVPAPVFSREGGPIAPGTALAMGGTIQPIYYTLDGRDPRLAGGGLNPSAITYSGPVNLAGNSRVFARARSASGNWSPATAATFVVQTPALVITEIMYHPASPGLGGGASTNAGDDFEYIELKNIGSTTIDLRGARFTAGIEFDFTAGAVTSLAPGTYMLVVRNLAAFNSRYGPRSNVAGEFLGQFDNAGERLQLLGPLGEPLHDFSYRDGWYPVTDGAGFSLVVVNESAPREAWDERANWRPSGAFNGSPGTNEPAPPQMPAVVVNEVMVQPTGAGVERVELHNPTGAPADISGWFLTDDPSEPKKFRVSDNTIIPAGGYHSITSFHLPQPIGFTLRDLGDEILLFSANALGVLTGYRHGFDFEAAEPGVSFGRIVLSTGDQDYPAVTRPTFGDANSVPVVGPVVIREVMYHPPDVFANGAWWDNQEHEFIELLNLTASPLQLFDPARPENVWRLRGAVDFDFAPNTMLPANGALLLVKFNPVAEPALLAAFRTRYGLGASATILGPWRGKLDNSEDDVKLYKPGVPADWPSPDAGRVPYILVDRVEYSHAASWPLAADGYGHSLQRLLSAGYGNEPTNWMAARPTPLGPTATGPSPTVTAQPQSRVVVAGSAVSLSVAAAGTGPFTYQWRMGDTILPGATNATLSFASFRATNVGVYSVMVMNATGWVLSSNATLAVVLPPQLLTQPQSQSVPLGGIASFAVEADGARPLAYQWRFGASPIPGATNAVLTLPNVMSNNAGGYTVVITNIHGGVTSAVATLEVRLGTDIEVTFIAPGAAWKFLDRGQNLGTAWRERGYDDSGWSNGLAQLGYGDGDEITQVSYGPDINNKYPTTYFRRAFVVHDPDAVRELIVRVLRDDGAVLYLNGAEIYRNNMPTGVVAYSTFASVAVAGGDETAFYSTNVSSALLVAGTNVLAVEIHQANGGSSDLSFDAELKATQTILPPVITESPQSQIVNSGTNVTLRVAALGSAPLSYRWRRDNAPIAGATASTHTILNAQASDGGSYSVVVSNSYGMATSAVAVVTVNQVAVPPSFTTQPQSQTVVLGKSVTFVAVAEGTPPLHYQWRLEGTALPSATNATLTLTNVQLSQAGNYTLVVTNLSGRATSAVVTLTVLVPPAITSQPQTQWVLPGSNVTFTVVASGTPPLSYQWRKDGLVLSGATGASLTVSNVQLANAGDYTVVIANAAGAVTSAVARLTVLVPPVLFVERQSNNSVRLSFLAVANVAYALERSPSLAPPAWTTVTNIVVAPTNHLILRSEPLDAARFYRVRTR